MGTNHQTSQKSGERKLILCDPDKCDGCGICELVCSYVKEGAFNPSLSRIRTVRLDHVANMAIACRQCEQPKCFEACNKSVALKMYFHILVGDPEKWTICVWCLE